MNKSQKIQVVGELKDKLSKAKSLVLSDYRGLTHHQLEEIKKAMKEVGAEFVVTKNTLLKISLERPPLLRLTDFLTGPTATLFSYQDEIAPLGILAKFMKNFGLIQVKVGILNDKVLSSDEVLKIAALPPREILLATLVTRLKSPLYGLHHALNWNTRKLVLTLKAAGIKS